jgi:hypothetical protein
MRLSLRGRVLFVAGTLVLCAVAGPVVCRQNLVSDDSLSKRIFWIIPNFRTSPTLAQYKPLAAGRKFDIASKRHV